MSKNRVVIIGGGAAGLMAASRARLHADEVTVIERNRICGRKLRITGKGRCNITNIADTDEIMDNITSNRKFMYSALGAFSNYDVIALMEDLGVATKVERGGRVFPVSDSAKDVADALWRAASGKNVRYITAKALAIEASDGKVRAVRYEGGRVEADSVILATGGKSYPLTGSDGSGYAICAALGHTIVEPKPSLVPLVCREKFCAELMGLTLKNVELTVLENGKKIYSDFGELLFTHFGISGPIVLSASAHMRNFGKSDYEMRIDLKHALDEKQLDARILRDFGEEGKKHLINAMDKLLPKAIIPVIIKRAGVPAHKAAGQLTHGERQKICRAMKSFALTVVKTRPIDEAIITAGGVQCSEINPSTMESKIVGGLYFAGEIIDVDAYTGGYNLQIAFSTGYLAGESAGARNE